MSKQNRPMVTTDRVNALAQIMRTLALVWRLLKDSRVPFLPKLIIPAAMAYVISPIDLLPDFILGLGQLDDLGIILLSIPLFIEFCPREIVEEHRRTLQATRGQARSDGEVVEGLYRVMRDDDSNPPR